MAEQWKSRSFSQVLNGYPIMSPEGVAAIATDPEYQDRIVRAVNRDHAFDVLKDAVFAALVLCNGLSTEETTIAYNGRDDFSVTDKLRAALRLAEG